MFFSVIVPVYNVKDYLHECVDSILAQTFTDFELILVDDGSTDGSGAICDAYAQQDARVQVVHKENGGQSTARNCGVNKAQGQFVVFLDSDDFLAMPKFLEDVQAKVTEKTQVVLFRYKKYYRPDKQDDCGISLANIRFENKGELFYELVKRDAFFCSCWSKCVSLNLLRTNNIRFDEHLMCEDMDWYYSLLQYAEHFVVIDQAYICYRQRENSVTSSFKEKSIADYIKTLQKWERVFSELPEGREKQALLSSLAKLYCNLLISYSRHRAKLKGYKKDIFGFKKLLNYSLNPRTKKIGTFSKLLGLHITCLVFNFLDKVRK